MKLIDWTKFITFFKKHIFFLSKTKETADVFKLKQKNTEKRIYGELNKISALVKEELRQLGIEHKGTYLAHDKKTVGVKLANGLELVVHSKGTYELRADTLAIAIYRTLEEEGIIKNVNKE
jgi:hypothetical protein